MRAEDGVAFTHITVKYITLDFQLLFLLLAFDSYLAVENCTSLRNSMQTHLAI